MSETSGFTLLEILITLTLIAILSLITIPTYQFFQTSHEQKALRSQLSQAIALTRIKAYSEGKVATLCKSKDKKTCGGNWLDGYIMMVNKQVVHTFQNPTTKGTLKWRAALNHQAIQFNPTNLFRSDNGTFWYCPEKSSQPTWLIVVNKTGHVREVTGRQLDEVISEGAKFDCNAII